MSDDSHDVDTEIIRAAYAEKVKEAFIVFADNISVGQQEKSCRDRFVRAMALARKARDLAVAALRDPGMTGEAEEAAAPSAAAPDEALSAEDQAIIDSVLAGTTGVRGPTPTPTRFGKL